MTPPGLSDDVADLFRRRTPPDAPLSVEEMRTLAATEVAEASRPAGDTVRSLNITAADRSDARWPSGRLYSVGTHEPGAPVTIWFHGGGFILGSLDTSDDMCRELCAAAGTSVLSVEYSLAPEHPWPAQRVDCQAMYDAVRSGAIAELGMPSTVALAGESAGGHLAANIARNEGQPPAGRLLLYPVVTSRRDSQSYRDFAVGFGLDADGMAHAFDLTFTDGDDGFDLKPPVSSPNENYYIITAECDVLRDEAESYVHALRAAGATVTAERFVGMPHGFMSMTAITPIAAMAIARAAHFLSKVHRTSTARAIRI